MGNDKLAWTWFAILAVLAVVTGGLRYSGFSVEFGAQGFVLFWCTGLLIIVSFVFKPRKVWAQRALLFGHGVQIFSAIGLCGGLASYWITSFTHFPFADGFLYNLDLTVGLDWREIYQRYLGLHWLQPIMQNLYLAIFYTPMLVLLGLSATGQAKRIELFFVAFAMALAMTLIVFPFFPAKTALIHLIGSNPPYIPVTGVACADIIADLRLGNLREIEIHKMFGLVTFPSFHAATGVLLSWACWTMRLYRWPIAIVNAGMVIATPLEGAHYFVDVAGGIWVAVAAIYAAQRLQAASFSASFPTLKGRRNLDRPKLPDRSY